MKPFSFSKTSIALTVLTATLTPPFSPSAWASQGGDHSGGGNAINYRIIESYIKPIEKIEGYNEFLKPVLEDIHTKLPRFHELLQKSLREMTWYVVPARIKPLAEQYTGLPFVSDQLTVQNLKTSEVFIDSEMFKDITDPVEKGRHLLHELIENAATRVYLGSNTMEAGSQSCFPYGNYMSECMKVVRVSVNLLSDSKNITADALSQSLKNMSWKDADTAEEIARQRKLDQARKEKEAEEIRKNLPAYKQILDQFFSGLDPYCASVGYLGISYQQVKYELSGSQRRLIKEALIKLSATTFPIAFRSQLRSIEDARHLGFSTSEVTPLYNPLISSWVKRDLEDQFFQGRTIPSLTSAKSSSVEDLAEPITNLYKVCSNLPQTKAALYQFVNPEVSFRLL